MTNKQKEDIARTLRAHLSCVLDILNQTDFIMLACEHREVRIAHNLQKALMNLNCDLSQFVPAPKQPEAEPFKPMKDFCESLAEQAEIYNRTAPKRIPNN